MPSKNVLLCISPHDTISAGDIMKKWIKPIAFIAAFAVACAFSRYDTESKFGFVALAAWLAGSYFLLRGLRSALEQKTEKLKGESVHDGFSAFVSFGFAFTFVAVVFVTGFTGKFDFNTYVFETIGQKRSLLSYVMTCALANAIFVLIFMALIIILQFLPVTILGYRADPQFCGKICKYSVFFIMLSHICGIVDFTKILHIIGEISKTIRQ